MMGLFSKGLAGTQTAELAEKDYEYVFENLHELTNPKTLDGLELSLSLQKVYNDFLSSQVEFAAPVNDDTIDDDEDGFCHIPNQIILSQADLFTAISSNESHETAVIEQWLQDVRRLKEHCILSEMTPIDIAELKQCVRHPYCAFYDGEDVVLHAYYDTKTDILLLESLVPVSIVDPINVSSLYLVGDFTLQNVQLKLEHRLFVQGHLTLNAVEIDCGSLICCGEKILCQQTVLKSKELLLLKAESQFEDTTLTAQYCKILNHRAIKTATITAPLCQINGSEAEINNLHLKTDTLILQTKNNHEQQSLIFNQCNLQVQYLLAQGFCQFSDATINTEKGACLSPGFFLFHQDSRWTAKAPVYILKKATVKTDKTEQLKLDYLIIYGALILTKTRLHCCYLQQSGQLSLHEAAIETDSFESLGGAQTVFQNKVTIDVGTMRIYGILSSQLPTKTGQLTIRAKVIKIYKDGVLKTHTLDIEANTLINKGCILVHQTATLKIRRILNQNRLESATLIINGNFLNLFRVSATKKLTVSEGLVSFNAGFMFANNPILINKASGNIGVFLPNFSANIKDIGTASNAWTVTKTVAPVCIPFSFVVTSLAEMTYDAIRRGPSEQPLMMQIFANVTDCLEKSKTLILPEDEWAQALLKGLLTYLHDSKPRIESSNEQLHELLTGLSLFLSNTKRFFPRQIYLNLEQALKPAMIAHYSTSEPLSETAPESFII